MCKKVVAILFGIVATCSFFSCSKDDENGSNQIEEDPSMADSRTILAYMVAENNLSPYSRTNINMMLEGIRNGKLKAGDKLIIFIDDTQKPRFYELDRTGKDSLFIQLEPVKTYDDDFNTSDASRLQEALEWTKKNYPASSYGLVMWSHASGWIPSTYSGDKASSTSPRRSFGLDNEANSSASISGHQMNIDDMAKAIENAGGVDFMFFDACFMSCIEVVYELRNATKYIIGSPAEIPCIGADYSTMVPAMFKANDYAEHMIKAYYDAYNTANNSYGINITAIKTEGLDNYAAYMKQVVYENEIKLKDLSYSSSLNYLKYQTWSTKYPDFFDMQGIMLRALSTEDYNNWKSEVSKVIVGNLNTGYWYSEFTNRTNNIVSEECCGVSMFLPSNKYGTGSNSFTSQYNTTAWGKFVWNLE